MSINIKELPWVEADVAFAEALGMQFSISHEEGLYWGFWRGGAADNPKENLPDGFKTLGDAKASAQDYFKRQIMRFVEA